jgi:hypothetical protein
MAKSRVNMPVETSPGAKSSGTESGSIWPRKGPDRSGKLLISIPGSVGLLQETGIKTRMAKKRPAGKNLCFMINRIVRYITIDAPDSFYPMPGNIPWDILNLTGEMRNWEGNQNNML